MGPFTQNSSSFAKMTLCKNVACVNTLYCVLFLIKSDDVSKTTRWNFKIYRRNQNDLLVRFDVRLCEYKYFYVSRDGD